jgi:hypothetical protein
MILKQDYLVKLNNKNKIQELTVSLNYHPYEDVYSVQRSFGQRGGKEIDIPVIFFKKNECYPSHEQVAQEKYLVIVNRYLSNGYKSIRQLTDKPQHMLSDDELSDLIRSHGFINSAVKPIQVEYKAHFKCHPGIYDKNLYVVRCREGCRVTLYYEDGKILTYNKVKKDYNKSLIHILQDPVLIHWFKENPNEYLDCRVYSDDILYPLKDIIRLVCLKAHTKECKKLKLEIVDIISEDVLEERIKKLNKLKRLFTNNSHIRVATFKKIAGFLKIQKEYIQAVKEGFAGLLLYRNNMPYGMGKKSSMYVVSLLDTIKERHVVLDAFFRDNVLWFKIKKDEEYLEIPSAITKTEYKDKLDFYKGKIANVVYVEPEYATVHKITLL